MNQKKAKQLRRAFRKSGLDSEAYEVNGIPVQGRKLYQKAKRLSNENLRKLSEKLEAR